MPVKEESSMDIPLRKTAKIAFYSMSLERPFKKPRDKMTMGMNTREAIP